MKSANDLHSTDTPAPRPHLTWSRLLVYVGLALLSLALTGSFLRPNQCQTRGCSPYVPSLLLSSQNMPAPDEISMTANGQLLHVWVEFGDSGVFTPTTTAKSGTIITTEDGQTIPFLDDLATKGYIAIRVPHAPPTYTPSSLIPGISANPAVQFSYFSPPTATIETTVPISITRRADLEAIVNTQYPIADSQSHWEVWWLPEGEKFPLPTKPFRLEAENWPPPLGLAFQIDFGAGVDANNCAGCPIQVLANNGYLFVGPYSFDLRYGDTTLHDPLVSFGPHCGYVDESLSQTIGQYISPTVPFTHVFCVENWDTFTRTFTINAASAQGWDYTYFWQVVGDGSGPQPAGNPPFTVEVGPVPSLYEPGTLSLLAVHTPAIAITETLRETLYITATSTVSPEVKASNLSIALAPGYTLEEGGTQPPTHYIYLPLVLRQ